MSIKRNFIYKSVLTVSTYLISFITLPYITRVLGVEKIGLVNFVDNIASYFLLFAMMGTSILGVREISAVSNNIEKRSQVFFSIIGLNIIFLFVVALLYIFCIIYIPKFHQYEELLYIGIAKIIFTVFLIEWFYTGLEDFRYISIRSIIIKIIYAVSVFLFVKSPEDYKLYFILTTGMVVLNSVINILYARHFVEFNIKFCTPLKFLKENIILGIYLILNSMYSTFNVLFLGLVTSNEQVGYYTTAFKLYSIILAFFSAFTTVMLPRMSSLLSQGDKKNFDRLVTSSLSIVYTFCIPLILISIILAPDIIYSLSGAGYEGAIIPMIIIMPTVFMVGVSQVLAVQIITPLRKDNILFYGSIVGAISGIVLNIILVPKLQSIGSAITLFCSESAVTILYVFYVLQKKIINLEPLQIIKSILLSLPSAFICILSVSFIKNCFLSLLVGILGGTMLWCLTSYYAGNRFIISLVKKWK